MKRLFLILLLSLGYLAGFSQTLIGKVEEPFSFDSIYVTLYGLINSKSIGTHAANIENNKFQFTLKVAEQPVRAELWLKNKKEEPIWENRGFFYLSKDSVFLFCKDSLKNLRLFNSGINYDHNLLKDWVVPAKQQYRDATLKIREESRGIPLRFLNTKQYQQSMLLRFRHARAHSGLSKAYADFARAYPSSWMSLVAIDDWLRDRSASYTELNEVFSGLDDFLKESSAGVEISRRIKAIGSLLPGSLAPLFALPDKNGKMVELKSYKGKYVLLEFWSSGCGLCRQESPHLKEAYTKYHTLGFDILSISLDDEKRFNGRRRWLDAIEKDGTGIWQQVSDLKGSKSPVAALYNIFGIPDNYLIDPDGKVLARDLRGADLDACLKKIFKQ